MSPIVKHIPNTITSMNLLCGVLGILCSFEGQFPLAFCFMLVKYGWAKALSDFAMNKTTYVLRMKLGYFTMTMPVCGVLMALHLIEFGIVNAYHAIKGEDEEVAE